MSLQVCEGLEAGQGPWKVGTSVRNSISHSTCLCLRMKRYLGNLRAIPDLALAPSRMGAGSAEVPDHPACVNTFYLEDPRGPGEGSGIAQVFQSQNKYDVPGHAGPP